MTIKDLNYKEFLLRLLIYIFGLFILAIGVTFVINADLGISPVNAPPLVLSFIIEPLTPGGSVALVLLVMILLQWAILGKNFKLIQITQLIFSVVFGYFVDLTLLIFHSMTPYTYLGQATILIAGIAIIAIGVAIYMEADIINLPSEAILMAVIARWPKHTFGKIKIWFDLSLVVIASGLSFAFLGGLYGIREGTVISALFIGKGIVWFKPYVIRIFIKIGMKKS